MNLQISEMLDMFDNETENEICSRAENWEHIKTQNVVKANFFVHRNLNQPERQGCCVSFEVLSGRGHALFLEVLIVN